MSKTFNDSIHGHIQLSALAVKIIDTPQFQRLRDVKQLGGCYYVYPGASSNRFEHSLGVAHLARRMVGHLKQKEPTNVMHTLVITDRDQLCVEIAGLCHDLGHGPFSHMFESRFLRAVRPGHTFEHEHASIRIFELLIEENNLLAEFQAADLGADDIHFIKELILGDDKSSRGLTDFVWKGRGMKDFLYEIVANKRNGIDVDKFDYLERDCHHVGIKSSFDASRLINHARVVYIDTDRGRKLGLAYHEKQAFDVYELFHTRYSLHKRVYQHRVCTAVELMLTDALIAADPHIRIPGKDRQPRRMSECIDDMHAYYLLTDYVVRVIENSFETELETSRHILNRLRKRQLYRLVGQLLLPSSIDPELISSDAEYEKEVHSHLMRIISGTSPIPGVEPLSLHDLVVVVAKLNFGKSNKNPVLDTWFYNPRRCVGASASQPTTASTSEVDYQLEIGIDIGIVNVSQISLLVPQIFQERYLRVYCKEDRHLTICKHAFDHWCALQQVSSETITPTPKRRRTVS